jgi:Na+-translocating ferredoxin:NAD+ oxidoreductase RNF subunit RnfB
MEIINVVTAVASIGGMGVVFGGFLGYASKIFAVEVDPKVSKIQSVLPGANCGGCGYPGCAGCATAIAEGKAPVNACPVGGAKVAALVGEIMGVSAEESEPQVAFVKCNGTCNNAKMKYEYKGISDCAFEAQLSGGGAKGCAYGCLGLGNCVKVCAFGALSIKDGVAVVDEEKCVACGKCLEACPKGLIQFKPKNKKTAVRCSSKDFGKEVIANCSTGCIGCGICEKNCKFDAIHVENNLAVIDYTKCKDCGLCAMKCPKHAIKNERIEAMAAKKAAEAAAAKAAAPAGDSK